jgi:hypothetical protein
MEHVAEALTGWRQGDAEGRDVAEVFQIVNEQTRQAVESPLTKVLREGYTVGLANHTILIARNGREIPIDDSGAPIQNERGHRPLKLQPRGRHAFSSWKTIETRQKPCATCWNCPAVPWLWPPPGQRHWKWRGSSDRKPCFATWATGNGRL